MFYFDFSYLIVAVLIAIVGGAAQAWVKSSYSKYGKIGNNSHITGAQAARRILDSKGLNHVQIRMIEGNLTDNFNPSNNVVSLSSGVYNSGSIAAVAIAAHECGHAIQHAEKYAPNAIRSALVPVTNICSRLAWFIIIIGMFLGMFISYSYSWVANIGIIMYATSALFTFVTLPVEFNASRRAIAIIEGDFGFSASEMDGVKTMLSAAASTYVAALFASVLQLLRIIWIVNNNRNRR